MRSAKPVSLRQVALGAPANLPGGLEGPGRGGGPGSKKATREKASLFDK